MNTISLDSSYSFVYPHFDTSQMITRRSLEADANISLLVGHQLSLFIESECPMNVCIRFVMFLMSHSPISPSSPPELRPGVIWRFRDLKSHWQVALTPDFVTLEAFQYSSRTDFAERLESILVAVQSTYAPSAALRVGVRYVDCIKAPHIDRIEDFFQPAVLGIYKTALGNAAEVNMTECLLQAEEGKIQCRWGLLPSGATHDPGIPLPPEGKSWVLDIDMFSSEQMSFDAAELTEVVRMYAGRIYAVFRWMIKDEFLRVFGKEAP